MSSNIVLPRKWTRRKLLENVAKRSAASVALMPFVPVLEAGAIEGKARRYVQWLTTNQAGRGRVLSKFWQAQSGPTLFPEESPYAPLNEFSNKVSCAIKVNQLAGFDCGGNPHIDTSNAALTGSKNVSGSSVKGNISSLDQIIANGIRTQGAQTLIKSLVLGFAKKQGRNAFSHENGQRKNLVTDPSIEFDRLFKFAQSAMGGAKIVERSLSDKRGSVLDFVRTQLPALRKTVSVEDRTKLDAHLTSVEELERRILLLQQNNEPKSACSSHGVDSVKAVVDSQGRLQDDKKYPAVQDAFIDIITLAFSCDITRVVHFQASNGHDNFSYPWLSHNGVNFFGGFHGWTHGIQGGDGNSKLSDAFIWVEKAMRWRTEQFVKLMARLNSIQEEDATVLDNTGLLWGSETSWSHNYEDATWILAGRMAGKLKTGQSHYYKNKVFHNQVLTTMAQGAGLEINHVGDANYGSGALSEFLN